MWGLKSSTSEGEMRQPNYRRGRGRGNPKRMGGGGGRNQTYDSSGPNVKVRGTAAQINEKYLALARDATSSGDRIMAENYFQHAEHYFRLMTANGSGQERSGGNGRVHPGDGEDAESGTQPRQQEVRPQQPEADGGNQPPRRRAKVDGGSEETGSDVAGTDESGTEKAKADEAGTDGSGTEKAKVDEAGPDGDKADAAGEAGPEARRQA